MPGSFVLPRYDVRLGADVSFVSDEEGGADYQWFASFIGVATLTVNWPHGTSPTGAAKIGLGLFGIPWIRPRNG